MWTDTTRAQHARKGLRLPSDMTDAEWLLLEPMMPEDLPLGRRRKWGWRELVDAMLYLLRGGLPWRMLPPGLFPPVTTVQRWFYRFRDTGLWRAINHRLVMMAREMAACEASPSACIIDSQSVKTTESGSPRGHDAGKRIKGRKRHILTDTLGLLLDVVVHTADIQDRDGGPLLLQRIHRRFPWLSHIFADGGYAGPQFSKKVMKTGDWTIEIIKRSDARDGFVVLPRRWVVERTLAWLNRNRRLAKDFERSIESATAWIFLASVQFATRKIARH
jgi:transposase